MQKCEQGGTESGTVVEDSKLVQMLQALTSLTDDDFARASGKAAQNAAHSASVSSHQGPSLTRGTKENPVNANTTKQTVRPEGFEPPTLGSEDRCSIQLSYGRVRLIVPTDVSIRDGLAQSFNTDSVRHHFRG